MYIELKTKASWCVSAGPTVLCSAYAVRASRGSGHVLIAPVPELGTALVAYP